jgi:peptidoglycan/LPS O-acetylase OafA/YrhL
MMEDANLFYGISYGWWTLICLLIAVLYFLLWPRPKSGKTRGKMQHIVLRWFHSLVWLALAAAALLQFVSEGQADSTSRILVYLSLVLYAIFITVFLKEKAGISSRS